MNQTEQQYLKELENTLWTAAEKLRSTLDASQYKHAVLGLIFVKYVSDSFTLRQNEIKADISNPEHEYYLNPEDFGGAESEEYLVEVNTELEVRDLYTEKNVFWLPIESRWQFLQDNGPLVIGGAELEIDGRKKKVTSVGHLIDNALEAIERDNTKLKGALHKRYSQLQIDQAKLNELINLIATIPFHHASMSSKDILGHVYEYMLGKFALAEGKKGGQFYTPASIVSLIVELIEPFEGRVYDPAMGSGGFFVQSEKFIEKYANEKQFDVITQKQKISIYGQEYNHTTWQLAAMNMAIRGLDYDFGNEPASTYTNVQHPDLRADFIMANPPFNMKEWDTGVDDNDPRWKYGTPPNGNANFAWVQHMLHHLAPKGKAGIVLANGSLSSSAKDEFNIRKKMLDADVVDCIIALPNHLFTNTQISASIWLLNNNKAQTHGRIGETLFIQAENMGFMETKTIRKLTNIEHDEIVKSYLRWGSKNNDVYQDIPGFCKSVNLSEIEKHKYSLVPGRYVGFNRELLLSKERKQEIISHIGTISNRLELLKDTITLAERQLKGLNNG